MVYNHFIKCQVCGAITRIRLQVGFLEHHPINVVCGQCGTSLYGYVDICQSNPGLKFHFENADETINANEADYVVECSGEFPTCKPHIDSPDSIIDLSPFMRYVGKMGQDNYNNFSKTITKLNEFRNRWSQYKRIIDLFDKGDRTYLSNEIWKMLPKENFPCRNEFEIARAVHMIEVLYLIGTLRKDVISDLSLSESVMQLNPLQLKSLITFLSSHEGYSLEKLQSSVYKIYDEFIAVYPFLIPALCLQYCQENSVDLDAEGSTTSSFDSIKQFSLNAYETLGNLLVIPVALNNIKYRGTYNKCEEQNGKTIDLEQFISLRSKANRYHYCSDLALYTQKLQIKLNSKLRNAIGHNDVEYDTITQQITYVPDPSDRSKKEFMYLLEFEDETIRLFQAVTVISEYLYRLREVNMINSGHIPLSLKETFAPIRKVGRNDPCPCGSGLKYKKCHGKQNI